MLLTILNTTTVSLCSNTHNVLLFVLSSEVCTAAFFTGCRTPERLVITGCATLTGKYEAVSGIRGKLRAIISDPGEVGEAEGIWNFIVPAENAPGGVVKEMPDDKCSNPYHPLVAIKLPKSEQANTKVLSAEDIFDLIELCLLKKKIQSGKPSRSPGMCPSS